MKLELKAIGGIELTFDINFKVGDRHCYTRRNAKGTFLYVGNLNFLGNPSFTLARCSDNPAFTDGYYIPRLSLLSLNEVQAFARNIVWLYESHQSTWNYEHRRNEFIFNAGEIYHEINYKLEQKIA